MVAYLFNPTTLEAEAGEFQASIVYTAKVAERGSVLKLTRAFLK